MVVTKRIEKNPQRHKKTPSTQQTAKTKRKDNPTAGCWRPSGDSEGKKLGERVRLIDEAQAVGDGEFGRPERHTTQFLAFLGGGFWPSSFDQSSRSRGSGFRIPAVSALFRDPPMHTAHLALPGAYLCGQISRRLSRPRFQTLVPFSYIHRAWLCIEASESLVDAWLVVSWKVFVAVLVT
ncbi:hypothetical protein VTN49DRAFT_7829 [Thermomyces lanuginosus]|uniref:uncharacterized protein n=1 Tax=Thermomyces lanuginosus TaxID=5541 RepID=UPI0037448A34